MVGLDLHTESKCKKDRSEYGFWEPFFCIILFQSRIVCKNQGCHNPREIGDGLHLGIVSNLDNLHII